MIVTFTPNPSVDRTYALELLAPGEVLRSSRDWIEAGGKGVNVSRVLSAHGIPTRAVLPVGGPTGDSVLQLLAEAGIATEGVPIAGDLRCNVTLAEPDGSVTKVNALGPELSDEELVALVERVVDVVGHASESYGEVWFVACGSLTPGAPEDLLARVAERVRDRAQGRVRIAVDTSGAALATAIRARPDIIKPNLTELEELCARPLSTFGEVVDAARGLVADTVGSVLVSLGADGALLVTPQTVLHAEAPAIGDATTTVGAGDALLAGYLSREAEGPEVALRHAVAFGAAAVRRPIGAVVDPAAIDVPAVSVTEGFTPSRPSRRSPPARRHEVGAEPAVSLGDRGPLGERA